MIRSFRNALTRKLFDGDYTPRVARDVARRAQRSLQRINAAAALGDLRWPQSNRLEQLAGDLKGYYSIRVNRQWRIIFRWQDGDAHDVGFVDYH